MLDKINLERQNTIGKSSSQTHVIFMCNISTCMSNDIYSEGKTSGFTETLKNVSKELIN